MERKVLQYSEEFKQEAVHLALQSDSVSAVAHDLGMPEATLHTGAHKARNQGIHAYSSHSTTKAERLLSKVCFSILRDTITENVVIYRLDTDILYKSKWLLNHERHVSLKTGEDYSATICNTKTETHA